MSQDNLNYHQDYEQMVKKWQYEHIEYLIATEAVVKGHRDQSFKDIFNKNPFTDLWQDLLDQVRQELKKAKNDFRNRYKEEFIPSN